MNVPKALKNNTINATALAEDETSSHTSPGKGKHAQPKKLQHMISSASEKKRTTRNRTGFFCLLSSIHMHALPLLARGGGMI